MADEVPIRRQRSRGSDANNGDAVTGTPVPSSPIPPGEHLGMLPGPSSNDVQRVAPATPRGTDGARSFLAERAEALRTRLSQAVTTAAPEDEDFLEAYPSCSWAFFPSCDDKGQRVDGATVTILCDGGGYVAFLTVRQMAASTSVRFTEALELWNVLEAALNDPGTIWRPWKPQPGQNKRR